MQNTTENANQILDLPFKDIGKNHDGIPVLQWSAEIQTTVICVLGNRGRLLLAKRPDIYQYEDGRCGNGYTQGWCYDSLWQALVALANWNPLQEPYPDGWRKDMKRGVYRIGGDARYEYSNYDEEIEAHQRYAADHPLPKDSHLEGFQHDT